MGKLSAGGGREPRGRVYVLRNETGRKRAKADEGNDGSTECRGPDAQLLRLRTLCVIAPERLDSNALRNV